MTKQRGITLLELMMVCAVSAVVCAVAVPSAVAARHSLSGSLGARRLALLLRDGQARAQARGTRVAVTVAADGSVNVSDVLASGTYRVVESAALGVSAASNYPNGSLEFDPRGWPALPAGSSPRAGRFVLEGGAAGRTVVVQLGGYVRCE